MNYLEEKDASKSYKEQYVSGLSTLIEEREQLCQKNRENYVKDIFKNPEEYRKDFTKMMGWPLVGYEGEELAPPTSEKLSDEDCYSVYRMQFEILKGLTMTGLFFKAGDTKKPLVVFQHGGAETPEFVSGGYGSSE